jgi:hypothetical protein
VDNERVGTPQRMQEGTKQTPNSPEALQRHLDWLYGPNGCCEPDKRGQSCICDHAYRGLGRDGKVDMGKGWVRTTSGHHLITPGAQDSWTGRNQRGT